mmetsp:Transcript_152349/g.280780  ORF Transcript_152349/g.280780 Transcript_152349/m.280780 type:complete len:87 (-) Transcript_152349:46-306(-)
MRPSTHSKSLRSFLEVGEEQGLQAELPDNFDPCEPKLFTNYLQLQMLIRWCMCFADRAESYFSPCGRLAEASAASHGLILDGWQGP